MYMYHSSFSQFPMFGHLGNFQYFATLSITAMSNLSCTYFCIIGHVSHGDHYGLNVYLPPKFTPNVMVLGGGAFE